MKRYCDICGIQSDDHWMMKFNTGARVKWMCWDCYKQSQYEVLKSEMQRSKRFHKQSESGKKRK